MTQLYNKIVGYSNLLDVNWDKQLSVIWIVKRILLDHLEEYNFNNIMVGGCGMGTEAVIIEEVFEAKHVVGVDISIPDDCRISDNIDLMKGSLTNLNIDDCKFSLVYSYHVLEHVSEPEKAISEMCRILKKNGVLFIGFPNRNRLLGYMGSCNNITLMQKIKWNLNDYLQRIKGRFKNEFGAHAGFTEKEFIPSANIFFSEVIPVRNDYYHKKYSRHNKLIQLMIKTGLSEYLFPSNYFICKK